MARKEKRAYATSPEQTRPPSLLEKWADFVKLSHTVFALPFALAATVLAARAAHAQLPALEQPARIALERGWPGWKLFGLILLAMVTDRKSVV